MTGRFWQSGRAGLLAAMLALPAWSAGAAEEPPTSVQDLAYGGALFYFYQQDYFNAGVRLMIAQQQQRLPHHQDDAQLLLGGTFLSYGMGDDAGKIFDELLAREPSADTRNLAWLQLAEIYHQHGEQPKVREALAKIDGDLPERVRDDYHLLAVNLLLAEGQVFGVQKYIDNMEDPSYATIARYNLAVALIKGGQTAAGMAMLDELGAQLPPDRVLAAIADRANLTMGQLRINDRRYDEAAEYFKRVRLYGPFADQALLALGWSAYLNGHYPESLPPWRALKQRDVRFAPALEAMIAEANTLESLQAYQQAVRAYQGALTVYEGELAEVAQAKQTVSEGALVRHLLEKLPHSGMGDEVELQWDTALPGARFLMPVLAGKQVHEAVKSLRDLLALRANLAQWEDTVPAFEYMLELRQQRYQSRLAQLDEQKQQRAIQALEMRRDALAYELERIEKDENALMLATKEELDLLGRLVRVQQRIVRISGRESVMEYAERYQRLRGLLTWQLLTDFVPRVWERKKVLREAERELQQTHKQWNSLSRAKRGAPLNFSAYTDILAEQKRRLAEQVAQTEDLQFKQQARLEQLALAELAAIERRLQEYRDQARFAIARLYDRGASAQQQKVAAP
ncbi:MAG: hypothetical protein AB1810_05090 [Pseudomonadota bacterium]